VGAWDLGKKRLENGENHDKGALLKGAAPTVVLAVWTPDVNLATVVMPECVAPMTLWPLLTI